MQARKVMILDDDPLILTLLGNIFHRRGYEVVTYSNPTECPHPVNAWWSNRAPV